MIPADGAGVLQRSADDILKASIHGAMRPWYGAKGKPHGSGAFPNWDT